MILDTLKRFNWLDILVAVFFLKISYSAIKKGALVELFKISGTICSIYVSFHYVSELADFFEKTTFFGNAPREFVDFSSLTLLAITGYLVFVILRLVTLHFIKIEVVPKLSRWGGLALGITRFFLFSSLFTIVIFMSTLNYFERSIETSYSARRLIKIAPSVYSGLWNNFSSKFMPEEKLNQAILDIQIPDSGNE